MLIPYQIETLYQRHPIANWIIMAICVLVFVGQSFDAIPDRILNAMVLSSSNPMGLIGYMFLHGSLFHLLGNMLFLWVFGNAICSNTNNWVYPILFLALGVLAGAIHLLVTGTPVIGASGAINGIIGLALAMYPINRVYVLWFFVIRWGSGSCPVWVLAILWFLFDFLGAVAHGGGVAYWAHIGGLIGGMIVGLVALQLNWVQLTQDDNRSLLEFLKGDHSNR